MVLKKEFYFVRHGQTDHNKAILDMEAAGKVNIIIDDPGDIPLNATGRKQAEDIALSIARLPVKTVCVSPLLRAKQTHAIISGGRELPHVEIAEFKECSPIEWMFMEGKGEKLLEDCYAPVKGFIDRVALGMEKALMHPGPVMIVAHGGVHIALCALMKISNHDWILDNCGIVHFVATHVDSWQARLL